MRRVLGLLAVASLVTACSGGDPLAVVGPFTGDPQIKLVSPTEGQQVPGGVVNVQFQVSGRFKIVPAAEASNKHLSGEGHVHLFLDCQPTPPGQEVPKVDTPTPGCRAIIHTTQTSLSLTDVPSGPHTLYAELAFSDHTPLQNAIDKVDFTVVGGAPQPAPSATASAAASPSAAPSSAPSTAPSPAASASGVVAATVQLQPDPTNGGKFVPPTVTIKAGDTVEWDWIDSSAQHTVTDDGGAFDSGLQGAGSKFKWTYATAGTYTYHCSVHPAMTGTVKVT